MRENIQLLNIEIDRKAFPVKEISVLLREIS